MATDYKAINTYPQGTPSGTDRLPYFDAGGTIRYTQYSNFQENTPPPTEWRNIGLDNIRIPYLTSDANTLSYAQANNASTHTDDHLGICIADKGKIVMPIMGQTFKWGATDQRYSQMTSTSILTPLYSGKANCDTYYTASAGNREMDTAIGFAHNYARFVNGHGIGAGEWYVPSPSECEQIITPNFAKLDYVIKILFGASFNFYMWTSEDNGSQHAYRYYGISGNINYVPKTTACSLLLMCDIKMFQQDAP